MTFVSLTCPQCAAPLPRAAYWRTVTCTYCGTTVTRSAQVGERDSFRQALKRAHEGVATAYREVRVRDARYSLIADLGAGEASQVYLARRVHPFGEYVTLKLGRTKDAAAHYGKEADAIGKIQALTSPGSAYFSQRLPQLVAIGRAVRDGDEDQAVLALRHPTGYWGSLAAVLHGSGAVADTRHIVWIWRRVLEVLAYLHDNRWTHGSLGLEHLLVHPQNHGVQMIGFADAVRDGGAHAVVRDLQQLAWSMRALASSDAGDGPPAFTAQMPAPMASLLKLASEDAAWCARHGAHGIQAELTRAADESFGAPRFVVFKPD